MNDTVLIVEFDNGIVANLLAAELEKENIDFIIHSNRDSAYSSLFQLQNGWGHLEAAPADKERILAIYNGLTLDS